MLHWTIEREQLADGTFADRAVADRAVPCATCGTRVVLPSKCSARTCRANFCETHANDHAGCVCAPRVQPPRAPCPARGCKTMLTATQDVQILLETCGNLL